MTQSFDEWVRDNFYAPCDVPTVEQAYEAGAQSRQAEIDAWKDELRIMALRYERLQKRIYDALKEIEGGITEKHHISYIAKTLKGESND